MDRRGDEVRETTTEARAGTTPHIVRYILIISTTLLIAVFAVIVATGMLSVS